MAQMALAVTQSTDARAYHYFSSHACVFVEGSRRSVFVGGTLVGSYDVADKATRNAILIKLSEDPKIHLGKLVEAFGLSREQLRNLQKKYKAGGLSGVIEIKQGGREHVVTPSLRSKLYELFDAGASINLAHRKISARISRTMVGRTRKAWRLERELEASAKAAPEATEPVTACALEQVELAAPPAHADVFPLAAAAETESVLAEDGFQDAAEEIPGAPPSSEVGLVSGPSLHDTEEVSSELIVDGKKQYVQHAGAFILLSLLQSFGVYRHVENLRKSAIAEGDADRRYLGKTALRVALDAAIIALVIGQQCIEGVRRVATPSAKTLLRVLTAVPSESWVRGVLRRFADARGQALHLVTSFALIDQAGREHDARAWFYVSCAMHTLEATHDIRKVALWLGHASVQTTEIYVRADPTEKLDAINSVLPPTLRRGRFRAPDKLVASLRASRPPS